MENNTWGLAQVWNESLVGGSSRPLVSRDHLWASELDSAPIDLFLKLKGISPTNPPNDRSLRKFEAGNVQEWMVSQILKRAGILKETQKWSSYQYPGMMKVTGKVDFIAGGKPDRRMYEEEMAKMGMSDTFVRGGEAILKYINEKFPDGLEEIPLEIKSCSSFIMDSMENSHKSKIGHRMQAYHYVKSNEFNKGLLIYICKDDLRMMEFGIMNGGPIEDEYKGKIENISKYFLANEIPPKEKEIIWDEDSGKLSCNWRISYSGYLTYNYGYKDQREYEDKFKSKAGSWNRVLVRMKKGEKMTPKNIIYLEDMKDAGWNPNELVKKMPENIKVEDETE